MNHDIPFRADLHTHTFFSDGGDSPETLLQQAKERQLSGIAITDHDTVEAFATALPFAKQIGVLLLSGIEFSANHRKEPVHVLGYGFSLKSEAIHEFCHRHQQRRKRRNLKILSNLKRIGISIEEEDLEKVQAEASSFRDRTIGRPHIALVLVQRGIVQTVREAFHKYLGEGKVAYDPGEPISPEETIKVIHQAKGYAIIAHPHLLIRRVVINDLLSMQFDGLEAYYAQMDKEREAKWIEIGRSKKWIITGGSDYHGKIKPMNPLGASWVSETTFNHLYDRFLANN